MHSRPTISLCIPVFNGEIHIRKCFESILSQDFDSWEIVVVDDGSSDGTLRVLEEFVPVLGPRLRVIRQSNSGPLAARNRAFKAARGLYVMSVDIDDGLYPIRALSRIADAIEHYGNCDVILFNAETRIDGIIREEPRIDYESLGLSYGIVAIEEVRRVFVGSYMINPLWLKIFRRDILEDDNCSYINKRIVMGDDRLITAILLSNAKSAALVDKVVYVYNVDSDSISRSPYSITSTIDYYRVETEVLSKCLDWHLGFQLSYTALMKRTAEDLLRIRSEVLDRCKRYEYYTNINTLVVSIGIRSLVQLHLGPDTTALFKLLIEERYALVDFILMCKCCYRELISVGRG